MSRKGGFGGLGGLGGGGGMQGMIMKQVQKFQEEQERLMAELEEMHVEGSAGGGVVNATVTGSGDLVAIKIDPDAVDPDDVEMLEDMVVAAVRDALAKAQKVREEKLGSLMSGLPKIPGLSI
ncbi:MAG TPA: YbaB/EbfC family nucleoid-associated protein [Armatimonadetes bacterium]|jgi:DNA-binding YbaB/EbfC family protein|nr:YbaB/EbfC family nucleoid-associated protein [Armatimonadota bacterium]